MRQSPLCDLYHFVYEEFFSYFFLTFFSMSTTLVVLFLLVHYHATRPSLSTEDCRDMLRVMLRLRLRARLRLGVPAVLPLATDYS